MYTWTWTVQKGAEMVPNRTRALRVKNWHPGPFKVLVGKNHQSPFSPSWPLPMETPNLQNYPKFGFLGPMDPSWKSGHETTTRCSFRTPHLIGRTSMQEFVGVPLRTLPSWARWAPPKHRFFRNFVVGKKYVEQKTRDKNPFAEVKKSKVSWGNFNL